MDDINLGKIVKTDVRKIWNDEAKDFTPWLADNIEELAITIGRKIKVEEREKKVGNFELDIYAVDEESGAIVIIENQLDETDHKHLGQIITYAAGLEVEEKVIIWITTKVRDEHHKAIDWLNKVTNDNIFFFLVRIEVFRIDESKPAVKFIVESEPSEFVRTFGQVTKKASIKPVKLVWDDSKNNPITVSTWKGVFRQALERAYHENVDKGKIPVQTTENENEAEGFGAPMFIDGYNLYVESKYSAEAIRNMIDKLLRNMGKPENFLTILCEDGTTYKIPK